MYAAVELELGMVEAIEQLGLGLFGHRTAEPSIFFLTPMPTPNSGGYHEFLGKNR